MRKIAKIRVRPKVEVIVPENPCLRQRRPHTRKRRREQATHLAEANAILAQGTNALQFAIVGCTVKSRLSLEDRAFRLRWKVKTIQ